MLWFPCSSQPAVLKTAWTIAFLPRVAAFPHHPPPLSLALAKEDLTQKGCDEPNKHAVESGNPAPTFHKDRHVALDPALQPHSMGRAPGQPLLESCPWSTRLRYMKIKHQPVQGLLGTLLGGSYKSCQHGLPQAFSFSNKPGVRYCLSFAPPPSIFSEKAFCVPTVFIDISASWPFQLCKSEPPSSPFKVAPVPSHCP